MAVVIPGPADFFQGLISSRFSGDQSSPRTRNAMVFTSTLRQLVDFSSGVAGQFTNPGQVAFTSSAAGATGITPKQVRAIAQASGIIGPGVKTFIAMAINPKSVKFTQPKRFKRTDTREGSVFFHFSNSKGQNNDILTLTFSGNTGNIDLRGTLGSPETQQLQINTLGARGENVKNANPIDSVNKGPDTGALNKLLTWQNLYLLTREPMIIGNALENAFQITYVSAVLPVTIDFFGFFNNVLTWEDNAEKPNSRDYDFEFTVTRTEPDLDEYMSESLALLNDASLNVPSDAGSSIGQGGVSGA